VTQFEEQPPTPRRARLRYIILGIVVFVVIWFVSREFLWVWLNILEFGDLFVLPIYYQFIGGLTLAAIALVRLDFRSRTSLTWWILRLLLRLIRERGIIEYVPAQYLDLKAFKMKPSSFLMWQITKVLIGSLLLGNTLFGLALVSASLGWDLRLGSLGALFTLPFITPNSMSFAAKTVIPAVPTLTLIATPVLAAIALRLIFLIGITNILRLITPRIDSRPDSLGVRAATLEGLVSLALAWAAITSFFPSNIDYNTRWVILGLGLESVIFAAFALRDRMGRGLTILTGRAVASRLALIVIVALTVGSIMAVNTSIADARKIEWLGPYTEAQITVNRYLAQLDEIVEYRHNFSTIRVSPREVDSYVKSNEDLLQRVRLFDSSAAFSKMKPEIGLIPYVDFADSDIIRFNKTLYWSASLKPILPQTVRPEDRWYNEHLVYTHIPNGFLMLNGHTGEIVNSSAFFQQRQIYYGEQGLFADVWAAYPRDRLKSDELLGHFYRGKGGVDVPPPLSWLFEFNFFLAFGGDTIHVIRYRDIIDRMQTLFPYFTYNFGGKRIDVFPATDGQNSYWIVPLIVTLNTGNVPWSVNNPYARLLGLAIIDTYDGSIQILATGNDFFTDLFKRAYRDYVIEDIPVWLRSQLRYPEELFEYRVEMYNFYHVDNAATFITAKEFFEAPTGLDTFYVFQRLPPSNELEYVGILSLELRGSGGRNLAGYMVIRNEYPNFGQMVFYSVPLQSDTKLLGPTAVQEALEKNPQFREKQTLLRSPRIGDRIFYRVGDYDVYFIPVYTAGETREGVVTQLGAVAAVSATFTGEYYVGLAVDNTATSAFRQLLLQLAGAKIGRQPPLELAERVQIIRDFIKSKGFTSVTPTALNPDLTFREMNITFVTREDQQAALEALGEFISKFSSVNRSLIWFDGNSMNIGFMIVNEGLSELHYVTITLQIV